MSISAVALALYHSKATYSDRLVLIAIANFEGEHGAWPAIETIGRLSGGINRRTVQRSIDSLIALGELREERREGFTNRYYVEITCPDECDRSANHRENKGGGVQTTPVQMPQGGVASTTKGGGVQTTGGAVSRPPEPLKNLEKQPLLKPLLNSYRLPEDWQPRENDIQIMNEHFPEIDLKLETHAFRDYWAGIAGSRAKKSDWDATWRNWIRNNHKRQAQSNKPKNDWNELDRWAKEQDGKDAN